MRKARNLLIYAISLALLTFSYAVADEKKKIGFVYVGPVGDYGWTYQHDKDAKPLLKNLAIRLRQAMLKVSRRGQIPERVIRQLAASGHDLIFTTSFGFMNPTIKVAKQFPNVKFESATGV